MTSGFTATCQPRRTVTDTFCVNYEPIRANPRLDSPGTISQVKGQNAVYDRLCKVAVEGAAKAMLK